MSFTELQAEVASLPLAELKLIHALVETELAKQEGAAAITTDGYLGCARGLMQFRPGWDEKEPLETWEALRDDSAL